MTEVFKFKSYKRFLNIALPSKGENRGGRARLAAHLNCKPGFISLVLAGKSDLSLEHSLATAEFLKLSPEETKYFLILVQKDRASSARLKRYFAYEGEQVLEKREEKNPGRPQDPKKYVQISQKKQHHANWRKQAMASLKAQRSSEVHYTSVIHLSTIAAEKLRRKMIKMLEDIEPIIKEDEGEGVFFLNLDLFEARKS